MIKGLKKVYRLIFPLSQKKKFSKKKLRKKKKSPKKKFGQKKYFCWKKMSPKSNFRRKKISPKKIFAEKKISAEIYFFAEQNFFVENKTIFATRNNFCQKKSYTTYFYGNLKQLWYKNKFLVLTSKQLSLVFFLSFFLLSLFCQAQLQLQL